MSLESISPLDGRYANQVSGLSPYFSEAALIRYRFQVECAWLVTLSERCEFSHVRALTGDERNLIQHWIDSFGHEQAQRVKDIEARIQHDVKSVEYYLKECLRDCSMKDMCEWVHFCCTSEDISNLAYALMLKNGMSEAWLPLAREVVQAVTLLATQYRDTPIRSHTHGQPASPSTVGKELAVFVWRWQRQLHQLAQTTYLGKFNGAVGCYNAHSIAYPQAAWDEITRDFVEHIGLVWNPLTTQIESHDYMAELFHNLMRFNTITISFARDVWFYISLGYICQLVVADEVRSSTMPHKVNPIHFENAEANLGVSNALLHHLATALPVSRLQRDLTDSSTLRNIGSAFGHALIALQSIQRGLSRIAIDENALRVDLDASWALLAEAVQTVMRKHGYANPYEQLKALTRGYAITRNDIHTFIHTLDLPPDEKARLLQLTPETYTGLAAKLVNYIIDPATKPAN